MREKFNTIDELKRISKNLEGTKKLSLVGQSDFPGGNNITRQAMNDKHHIQHLAIDNPEFAFFYDGKENMIGNHSSFYTKTDKEYKVIDIVKKYDERLKGKSYVALYFLYCKDDNSYTVVERKEVEDLTENYGFTYINDYLDQCEKGDVIPKNTVLTRSTSYDSFGNTSIGVNARILYAVHPAVQDDAIVISKSFAKRMISDEITSRTIPINENTLLLNLYGKDGEYQGLPNIGDVIEDGIICATRTVKESRMFSDMRDVSLHNINQQSDQIYYGEGEVIDINIYCNNPNLKMNKVNKQLIEYYNDSRWFYTKVYKTCRDIINSGSTDIDPEIHRWMGLAQKYLDTKAIWAWNDNTFSNLMVEILLRNKEPIFIGRKITGRDGNKTVVSQIWDDEEMPYLTTESSVDEYGVVHPKGTVERVDIFTNPNAIVNRAIPMVVIEGSVTFLLDQFRKHLATLDSDEEKIEIIIDVIKTLNPDQGKDVEKLYYSLSDYKKKKFIEDCISLNPDGTLKTDNGIYIRWDPFKEDFKLRDAIITLYEKYESVIKPYNIFVPKPKWGRDIFIGKDAVGYQYILLLKQSGKKGFSVRSAGSISDESLPEKSNALKTSRDWKSSKPIRFGEYETP